MGFAVHSPAFAEGARIPSKYTHDGENLSPPLTWSDEPPATRSFAVICEDPDAPSGTFRHWALCNISRDQHALSEGAGNRPGEIGRAAKNDFGHPAYDGPAPPRGYGLHHYRFRLLALDTDRIDVSARQSAAELLRAVQPHVIAEADTVGTYQR